MTPLKDRVAVITGGASGIGLGTARALASRGAKVVLVDRNAAALAEAAAGFADGVALACPADVSETDVFARVKTEAEARFGTVDVVMNNAGILQSGNFEDIPLEEWDRTFDINLHAVVRAVRTFLPGLIARGSGHIVNTASFAGLFPYAYDRIPYAASKAAVITLSEQLRMYLAPKGIGVTCLCPGPVRTGIGGSIKVFTEGSRPRTPGPQFGFRTSDEVGEMVADAIERNLFFLPTDFQVLAKMQERAADPEAFIAAQTAKMQEG